MQVRYEDGTETMEAFASMPDAEQAMRERLADPRVVSATIHKPGSEIVQRGKRYRLSERGQWVRVGRPLTKKAAKRRAIELGKERDHD